MKKIVVLVLFLFLLAGCASPGTPASPDTPATPGDTGASGGESGTAPAVPPDDEIVINIFEWDAGFDTSVIDRFNEAHPGIRAVLHMIPDNSEAVTKLDILAMGGGEIDIMPIADGQQFLRMQNGLLHPIDQFLEADGIDMQESFGDFADWARFDGTYYGLPLRSNIRGIFFNKDMFDAAGVPYPHDGWTWDEYIDIARRMTSGEGPNRIHGTYTHTFSSEWNHIGAQVSTLYTEDGMSNFDNPAIRRALEVRKMLDDEGIQQSFSEIRALNAMPNSAFFGGHTAMVAAGSWMVRDMKSPDRFPFDFNVGWTYMPRFDETIPEKPVFVTVSIMGIPATSPNPEAAWQFLRFYIMENAMSIALSGNIPSYQPAIDDQIINAFIEGSRFDIEYARRMFAPDLFAYSALAGAPPNIGVGAPQYTRYINEEVELFFIGSQDLETTIANVVRNVNAMIEEER